MGTPWKESEINYLYDAWGNTSVKQIAAHLGRSVNAVNCKMSSSEIILQGKKAKVHCSV